jgi:hypothetical protein
MATSTLGSGTLVLAGTTSGTTTLQATAVAGTTTLTLPAATDTLVGKATTDTLTNKTLTSPTITGGALNGTVGATTPATGAFTTVQIGTNPAGVSIGVLGIPNQKRIYGRNAANSADVNVLYVDGSNGLVLGPSDAATIDSSGNLLVGTTTGASSTSALMQLKKGGVQWDTGPNGSNGGFNVLKDGTTGVYLTSGATAWSGLSDETMKDIIEPIENASQKISTLRTVIGKYKTDEEGTRRAFLIAQDVKEVLPEAVNENENGKLGLQYTDVMPLLVAAIKEQQALITTLTARITALESA